MSNNHSSVQVKKFGQLTGHSQPVYALEAIPDTSYVISAGGDRWIALWDLQTLHSVKALAQATSTVYSLCYIPGFDYLAVGEATGGLHILNLKESKSLKFFTTHQKAIFKISYHPKRKWLYASTANGEISIWDIESLRLLQKIQLSNDKIRGICLDLNNHRIAIACSDSYIYLLTDELQPLHAFKAHNWAANTVLWHPSGDLISASRDAHIRRWKVHDDSEQLIQNIPAHNFAIYALAWSPNLNWMASASRDKTIKIWTSENLQFAYRINKEKDQAHTHSVNHIIWHAWNNLLVSCGDDKQIMIWDIHSPN